MKVLCIDADFSTAKKRPTWKYVKDLPKFGETYTVEEVICFGPIVGYILKEIESPLNPETGNQINWDASRFIPVEDIEEECILEFEEVQSLIID